MKQIILDYPGFRATMRHQYGQMVGCIRPSINLTLSFMLVFLMGKSEVTAQTCTFNGFSEYYVETGDVLTAPSIPNGICCDFTSYFSGSANGLGPDDVPIVGYNSEGIVVLAPDGSYDTYFIGQPFPNPTAIAIDYPSVVLGGGSSDGIPASQAEVVGATLGIGTSSSTTFSMDILWIKGADGSIDGYDQGTGQIYTGPSLDYSFNFNTISGDILGVATYDGVGGSFYYTAVTNGSGGINLYRLDDGSNVSAFLEDLGFTNFGTFNGGNADGSAPTVDNVVGLRGGLPAYVLTFCGGTPAWVSTCNAGSDAPQFSN